MTALFINKIVGSFDRAQYPLQEIEIAISARDAELEMTRSQIRPLPQQVKAHMFAIHTMATWFQMTGVGTPTERIQDDYTEDTKKAIEISCEQKLREYKVGIPRGMTARAALMDHIFKVALRNSTQEEEREMIQAMNRCSSVPHVQSFASRFCSWVITALKVAKLIAKSGEFKIFVCISYLLLFASKWESFLMSPIINYKTWLIVRPFQYLAYLYIGYIGLLTVTPIVLFVSKRSISFIENLTKLAHERAEIAFQNDQLKRAYITWMNETALQGQS